MKASIKDYFESRISSIPFFLQILGNEMGFLKKTINFVWLVALLYGCANIPNVIQPSQTSIIVEMKPHSIENTLKPGNNIEAKEHIFPFKIEKIAFDTSGTKALLFLSEPEYNPMRDQGLLVYYDLINSVVLWTKRSFDWKFKFCINDMLWHKGDRLISWGPMFFQDIIAFQVKEKIFFLNKNTGDVLWERKDSCCIFDWDLKKGFSGSLTAFDLNTGKDLWKREIKNKFGWTDYRIDDSVFYLAADGFHSFSLETGQGWSHEMKTGRTNEAGTTMANVGLALLNGLAGSSPSNQTYLNTTIWTGMASNLLFVDDYFYYTAKDIFICVEIKTGKEIWRVNFTENKTANTLLKVEGNDIIVLNRGASLRDGIFAEQYGTPFIAKFNRFSGEQKYFNLLDTKSVVWSYEISSNGYYLDSEEAIYYCDSNGQMTEKFKLLESDDNSTYGYIISFTFEKDRYLNYFLKIDNDLKPFTDFCKDNTPLIKTSKGLLILDSDFEIDQWFPDEQIFFTEIKYPNFTLNKNYNKKDYRDFEWKKYFLEKDLETYRIGKRWKKYEKTKIELEQFMKENSEFSTFHVFDKQQNYKGSIQIEDINYVSKDFIFYFHENALIQISASSLVN